MCGRYILRATAPEDNTVNKRGRAAADAAATDECPASLDEQAAVCHRIASKRKKTYPTRHATARLPFHLSGLDTYSGDRSTIVELFFSESFSFSLTYHPRLASANSCYVSVCVPAL